MVAMRIQILPLLLALVALCYAQEYRSFYHNHRVLTIVPGPAPPHKVVWEPKREDDPTQLFRIDDGFIVSKHFEPEEIVLDINGGNARYAAVIGWPRKSTDVLNQRWVITDTIESMLAPGLFMLAETVGTEIRAVVDFNSSIPISLIDIVIDYVFCIDTTGSMGGDIAAVKSNAVDITNLLYDAGLDARIAVADYRDFYARTYYSPDYPYDVKVSLSTDQTQVINGINALSLGGGGDLPESAFSCVMAAITGATGQWRPNAEKIVMVMADAEPLDPEPYTGYTTASVIEAATNPEFINVTYDIKDWARKRDVPYTSPVKIYSVVVRGRRPAINAFKALSDGTGGQTIEVSNSGQVVDAISAIISTITENIDDLTKPQLEVAITSTNAGSLPSSQHIGANFVVTNNGVTDATEIVVTTTWPCLNALTLAFTVAPASFQTTTAPVGLQFKFNTVLHSGSSLSFSVVSSAACGNTTVVLEVGATATDVPSGATSPVAFFAFNDTTPEPAGPECGALLACGNACYDSAVMDCIGSELVPKGYSKCGTGLYNTNAHVCINDVLCPKDYLLCGAEACYTPSVYSCIGSTTLCPLAQSSLCGTACYDQAAEQCCDAATDKLCPFSAGCAC